MISTNGNGSQDRAFAGEKLGYVLSNFNLFKHRATVQIEQMCTKTLTIPRYVYFSFYIEYAENILKMTKI